MQAHNNGQKGRSRNFIFTINNPADEWGNPEELIKRFVADGGKYIRFGDEIAPTTGTEHWQGFCEYKQQRFIKGISWSTFEHTAWLHIRNGSVAANLEYTGKEALDGVHEWGQRPGQGARKDWEEVHKLVKTGSDWSNIADHNPQLAYTGKRSICEAITEQTQMFRGDRKVVWCYGVTGAGKTHRADADGAVDMSYEMGSWRDYKGEKVVVWDEIDKWEKVRWDHLLKLMDKYPRNVQMRNSNCPWAAETIYITSTEEPGMIVPAAYWDQINRRVTEIHEYPIAYGAAGYVVNQKK